MIQIEVTFVFNTTDPKEAYHKLQNLLKQPSDFTYSTENVFKGVADKDGVISDMKEVPFSDYIDL